MPRSGRDVRAHGAGFADASDSDTRLMEMLARLRSERPGVFKSVVALMKVLVHGK